MADAAQGARSRALEKAISTLASGDFYEAQQLFKTVYHRHRSKKQLPESYVTLKEGARLQLEAGHLTCGIELGLMLVEALESDKVSPTEMSMMQLLDIVRSLPSPGKHDTTSNGGAATDGSNSNASAHTAEADESARFVAAAAKWANKMPHLSWRPVQQLHSVFAQYLWREYGLGQLARCHLHLTRSGDASLHAQVLRAAAPAGSHDVFLTQAVLQVLTVAKPVSKSAHTQHALSLWQAMSSDCQVVSSTPGGSPAASPLYNFLGFLLKAIQSQSIPLVRLLRDRYQASLSIDPTFNVMLDRIESLYLGVKQTRAKGPLDGLLGQLMQGMGEVDAASDEDDMYDATEGGLGAGLQQDTPPEAGQS